jgi:hypothetical protein
MALSSPSTPCTSSPLFSQTQELAQIELQDRLNHHSIKALHYMRSQRPKNTSKAYINKHKEWQVKEDLFVSSSYEKREANRYTRASAKSRASQTAN